MRRPPAPTFFQEDFLGDGTIRSDEHPKATKRKRMHFWGQNQKKSKWIVKNSVLRYVPVVNLQKAEI
jgi:hypothetical protein